MSRVLLALGMVALAAIIITPWWWPTIALAIIFGLGWLTDPDQAWQRRRAWRKQQRHDGGRILTDATLIVRAEAARIRAEQQTMPGLDMEDRWPW